MLSFIHDVTPLHHSTYSKCLTLIPRARILIPPGYLNPGKGKHIVSIKVVPEQSEQKRLKREKLLGYEHKQTSFSLSFPIKFQRRHWLGNFAWRVESVTQKLRLSSVSFLSVYLSSVAVKLMFGTYRRLVCCMHVLLYF